MIRKLIFIALLLTMLTACSAVANSPDSPVIATPPAVVEPTQSQGNGPLNSGFLPQPGDGSLTRGDVFIEGRDLLIMESHPVQIALVLNGSLPTPCHQLRVIANPPDEQNRIQVEAYSVVDPTQICIQVLEPFEAKIGLGSFAGGHYTVLVNGEIIDEVDV